MKVFCERFKELRIEKGLSVLALSKALNVSHSTITRWETEQRIPNIEHLKNIAKFFDVSSDYLIGLTEYE